MKISIVTSTHWEGDPRLNRHVRYLSAGGFAADLEVATSPSKLLSVLRAMTRIVRTTADVVLLPDPELFVLGALAARVSGKRPILDIHEDYPKTASERPWVPDLLRPLVRLLAALSIRVGRVLASGAVVAAPFLARPADSVVVNVPDPRDFSLPAGPPRKQVVYIGEVFSARGTREMVNLLARLPDGIRLLAMGKVSEATRNEMMAMARELHVADRLELTGRLAHAEAWERASGSLAGLALLTPAPAYLEAVATKLWEYMAAGVPPVVSDLPGQAAVVARIHPDLVCAGIEEAAAIITRIATDHDFRNQLVARGREVVEEEWERTRPDLAIQEAVAP